MNIQEMEKEYQYAIDAQQMAPQERIERTRKFISYLMSDNSKSTIDFHYSLLSKREYEQIYYDIRAAFIERPEVETYLLERAKKESDPLILGDILHSLGLLKSKMSAPLARKFVDSDNEYQREVSLYVLGWVGEEQDIEILNRHMIYENSEHLRSTAASAHRQMYWRLKELKNKLLASLKQGYEKEKSDEVIMWIIVMIESIAVKRLGLREDREDPNIVHGDLEKAKVKAAKFLTTIEV